MLLTVSGPPGSGRSTTAATLTETFDLGHISGGDIFRELTTERDMTAVEFNKLVEEDDQINRDPDHRFHGIALDRDDTLLESHLAGWLAGNAADLRFWFDTLVDIRAERIADHKGKPVDVTREETTTREVSEVKRYIECCSIDYSDFFIHDISLNIARWGEHEVSEIITSVVEAYGPETDEGKYPVNSIRYDF